MDTSPDGTDGPRRGRFRPIWALLPLLLWASVGRCVEVGRVRHRGLAGCVAVRAGKTRLIVVPAWAGRISVLDFGFGNELLRKATIDGKTLKPSAAWMLWDGNATDVVRRDGKNQWKRLWLHAWPKVQPLADGVALASEASAACGLSARRRYRLSGDGRRLSCQYTITAGPGGAGRWTIWERALVPAGGYVLAPIARGGSFPAGWIVRGGGKVDPPDRARSAGEFLCLRAGTRKGVGLAARLREGWIASVRAGHAMVIRYRIDPRGTYPHCGGAHAVFWIAGDAVELEPLSPEAELAAGRSASFTQTWQSVPLPPELAGERPEAVGRWIERRLRAGKQPGEKPAAGDQAFGPAGAGRAWCSTSETTIESTAQRNVRQCSPR